jgi:integrase
MYVKQNVSILFYLRRKKVNAQGKAPIYVRLTIDGEKAELATGVSIDPVFWDLKRKAVLRPSPTYKTDNKTLGQIKTDLERHVDLVKAVHEKATPSLVIEEYKTPSRLHKAKENEIRNLALSDMLDEALKDYLNYASRHEKAHQDGRVPHAAKEELLLQEAGALDERIKALAADANIIFDNKKWQKTLVLAIDEQLLHFLQLVSSGHRSAATLEKMWGRKRRLLEFMFHRHNLIDIGLERLDLKFLDQFRTFNMVTCRIGENSATGYLQALKETIIRCVLNGWLTSNMFDAYKCRYEEPHHDWLTMQELIKLIDTPLSNPQLSIIRDIYVFCSFTGLSYAEVQSLSAEDIVTGIDGEKWVTKNRKKSGGDETLPLLPIPLNLIEKYRGHPISAGRGKLLPVPSNQEYNRSLKILAECIGVNICLRTHKARFFFANEVAYNNGVQLKTVSRMLGQKSTRAVETYVSANRTAISNSMSEVRKKLFNECGELKRL